MVILYRSVFKGGCSPEPQSAEWIQDDFRAFPKREAGRWASRHTDRLCQRARRGIEGGIGHNLPQEAPQAFAEAVANIAEG
jgi:hypothetical protein